MIFLLRYALQKTVSAFAPSFLCFTDYSWIVFAGKCDFVAPIRSQVWRLDLGSLDLATWLHEEDTWLKEGGESLSGAKTAGFSIEMQNPAPQGEKLPIG